MKLVGKRVKSFDDVVDGDMKTMRERTGLTIFAGVSERANPHKPT